MTGSGTWHNRAYYVSATKYSGFSATAIDNFSYQIGFEQSGYGGWGSICHDGYLWSNVGPLHQATPYARRHVGFSSSTNYNVSSAAYVKLSDNPSLSNRRFHRYGNTVVPYIGTTAQTSFVVAFQGSQYSQFAFDGTNFYSVWDSTVYKYSGQTATVDDMFTHSAGTVTDVTHDGVNLFTSSNNTVYRHSGFSPDIVQQRNLGGTNRLIAWDGTALPPPPVPDFTGTPTVDYAPFSVDFTNTSTGATSYTWTFSGGTPGTSTDFEPTIAYDTPGTYNVSLQAFGPGGDVTETKLGYIEVKPPPEHAVTLKYKVSPGVYNTATTAIGDVGSVIGTGIKTAYWDDPAQDLPSTETLAHQLQIEAVPAVGNDVAFTVTINSVEQLAIGDGTGTVGDVKVEYEITI